LNIEELFDILKDGAWHDISEIADQINIPAHKLIDLSKFLLEKGIVKYEDETRRIKIEPEWRNLLPINSELSPSTS
jgi:DNA-binding IclR family transcriptional regulator